MVLTARFSLSLLRPAFGPSVLRPPSASPSPSAPGTALQPQESVGTGPGPDATLPLPGLLFGAPALLGLVLVLFLVALVIWRWWRQRRMASPDTPDGVQEGENHVWGSTTAAGGGGYNPYY